MALISCSRESKNGKVLFQESLPESGFNFPYFLFIPDEADTLTELTLIVEPNNSGFVSDDLKEHIRKAERIATREFYTGNYVAQKLQLPLLVPVFPRTESEWQIYTHAYDRDLALQKGNDLERLDLQLLAMVEDSRRRLTEKGFRMKETFFMTGFSASGTFVNRFTAIHPEKVRAVAAGGLNGLLILPLPHTGDFILNFPVGVNDFQPLFGKPFNRQAFKTTPQFWFMGELDDNDAIPYDDGYDSGERRIIYNVLGEEMQPLRWKTCRDFYVREKINAHIKTYPGIAHEEPDLIKDEIAEFFGAHLEN